jgi:RNA polymerase-interacting CarD/CdnL/TRCF family regulator
VSSTSSPFDKGDWIVHTFYGVGQITGIEHKQIGDNKVKYYKVEARNSTFFVPVKNAENERIRPVASKYILRKAIKALKDKPQEFDLDHSLRKKQITDRMNECSLVTNAELVRDLIFRRKHHRLNDHEENTLSKVISRLVREWAITLGLSLEEAQSRFDTLVKEEIAA